MNAWKRLAPLEIFLKFLLLNCNRAIEDGFGGGRRASREPVHR